MITKDNKDDRRRVEKALEAMGFKASKVGHRKNSPVVKYLAYLPVWTVLLVFKKKKSNSIFSISSIALRIVQSGQHCWSFMITN